MVFTITRNVDITGGEDKGSVWKQVLMSLLASLPFITYGVETTALTTSAHSGHFVTTSDDDIWSTTAMILGAGLSAPVYSFMIDRFGRKSGIYFISLTQGISCIPLFLEPNEASTIILHVLAGISSGGLFTVLPTYIRELCDTRIQAPAISLMMAMTTAGYLVKLVMDIEEMMFLMVGLVAAQFLLLLTILESPSYLVKVGKIERAKANVAKLKGLPESNPIVPREMTNLKDESDRATGNGNLNLLRILKNEIWRDGFKIGLVLNTTTILCGSIVFLDQDKTLTQLKMTSDPQRTLTLACIFAGSMFCVSVIRFLERKYVLTSANVVMVLAMGVLAIYTQADLTVSSARWVPVVALGVLVFAYGVAWGLPVVIAAEIFNFEIRATLLGLLFAYSQIIKLVHVHTFSYIEDYMGVYTVFYVFAGINLIGGVYTLFKVPDIKDKSQKQIERQLKRVPLLKFNK